MGFLLSNVLTRCQVNSSVVFSFISTAFSAINKLDAKAKCGCELMNSLIISNCLFLSFPKEVRFYFQLGLALLVPSLHRFPLKLLNSACLYSTMHTKTDTKMNFSVNAYS